MPDIKTRDIAKGTIKTIDKSAVAAERMKSAFIQTKEKAEHSVDVPESSAEEYASNRLESGIDRVSHEAVHQLTSRAQGRSGDKAEYRQGKGRYSEIQGKAGGAVASKTGAGGSSTKRRRSGYQGGGTAEEGSKRVCPFRRKKDD